MWNNQKHYSRQLWILILLFSLPLSAAYGAADFNKMLTALADNAPAIIRLIEAVAYVSGFWFVIAAIMQLKTIGQSSTQSHGAMSGPIVKLIVGILLIYLPSTIDVGVAAIWAHSAFGSDAKGLMSYTASAGDPFGPAKVGAIAIVKVVGLASFVRGLFILSHASDQGAQPGNFSKGIIHLIGGILAINIVETIRIIGNTLGFSAF